MQVSFQIWFQQLFENFYGFFDIFWGFITFFGEELFFMLFAVILYWVVDKKTALTIGCSVIVSTACNGLIKDICKIERPILNDEIRFVSIDNMFVNTTNLIDSYSFPSGHTMTASPLFTSLFLNIKNKKVRIISVIMIILVALSRLYLGVHWLVDVTVGSILGVIIAYGIYRLYNALNDKIDFLYIGIIILGLIILIFADKADTFKSAGAVIGFGSGALFERHIVKFNPKDGKLYKKILRVILGVGIVMGIRLGLKPLFSLISDAFIFHAIRYFILTFVACGLYPLLFKKINL